MSMTSALSAALSGLHVAQASIGVVAHNIANANTEGYVRKVANQESLLVGGRGAGVEAGEASRITDAFLVAESRRQSALTGEATMVSRYQNLIQDAFGEPGANNDVATKLGSLAASLQAFAGDHQVAALGREAVQSASELARTLDRMASQLQTLRGDADQEIGQLVKSINTDLQTIHNLNIEIVRGNKLEQPRPELLDRRDQAIKQLAGKIQIDTYQQEGGALAVYTGGGEALLDATPRVLHYEAPHTVGASTSLKALAIFRQDQMNPATGKPTDPNSGVVLVSAGVRNVLSAELEHDGVADSGQTIANRIRGGELKGLLDVRDTVIPALNDEIQELADGLRFALNKAHNEGVAWPPPSSLRGNNADLGGFASATRSGSATLAVIDRANGSTLLALSVDVAAAADQNALAAQINAGLGALGSASINASGRLEITLANGTHGLTIAEGDSSITVPDAAGRARDYGFSHYFGLNDLYVVDGPQPSDLAVRADILASPGRLATAKLDVTASPLAATLGGVGDNRAALGLANVLDQSHAMIARGSLPATSKTFGGYAADIVATAAVDARAAGQAAEREQALQEALSFRVSSVSGVNLDEELSSLMELQQAYAVSARMIAMVNEMLDELLGVMR